MYVTLTINNLDPEGRIILEIQEVLTKMFNSKALITLNLNGVEGQIEIPIESGDVAGPIVNAILAIEQSGAVVATSDELVTVKDIAERTHRSRQNISQMIAGTRGPGDWPTALNPGARHELYRWSKVKAWLDRSPSNDLETLGALGAVLAARNALVHLAPEQRAAVVPLLWMGILENDTMRGVLELIEGKAVGTAEQLQATPADFGKHFGQIPEMSIQGMTTDQGSPPELGNGKRLGSLTVS